MLRRKEIYPSFHIHFSSTMLLLHICILSYVCNIATRCQPPKSIHIILSVWFRVHEYTASTSKHSDVHNSVFIFENFFWCQGFRSEDEMAVDNKQININPACVRREQFIKWLYHISYLHLVIYLSFFLVVLVLLFCYLSAFTPGLSCSLSRYLDVTTETLNYY